MRSPLVILLLVATCTITMGQLRWEWTTPASANKPRHRQFGRLGIWNVRGLGPGNDKLDALVEEMTKRGLDALFITEVWRLGTGRQDLDDGSLFLYSGHTTPHHGVGAILSPRLTRAWRASGGIWQALSERVMTIRIPTGPGQMWQDRLTFNYVSVIIAYSPTEPPKGDKPALDKANEFYKELHRLCGASPAKDSCWILGDFNARVGTYVPETRAALGRFGHSATNSNGTRLINLAMEHGLSIADTFFRHKLIHKITWRHPNHRPRWRRKGEDVPKCVKSGHGGHDLDHVLVPQLLLATGAVRNIRAYNGTDVDKQPRFKSMDHALLVMDIAGTSRPARSHLPPRRSPRPVIMDRSKLGDAARIQAYVASRHLHPYAPDVDAAPFDVGYARYQTQLIADFMEQFGRPSPTSKAWMSAATLAAVQTKKALLKDLCKNPCPATEAAFKAQRRSAKKMARKDQVRFSSGLVAQVEDMQHQPSYSRIIRALNLLDGKRDHRVQDQPMRGPDGQFVEGGTPARLKVFAQSFQEVLNVTTHTTAAMVDAAPLPPECTDRPVGPRLPDSPDQDHHVLFTLSAEEIAQGLTGLHLGKAADATGVFPEMLKIGDWAAEDMTRLINDMIIRGEIPTAWTRAMIIPLYKNKGDAAVATNYRAIVITDIVSKVFTRAVYTILNEELDSKLMESQAGFRQKRSLTDHVFVMRQLMEAAHEFDQPLYTAFIDIAKAYDGIPRQALLAVLRRYGISDRVCHLITLLYRKTTAQVRVGSDESEAFDIESGVKQGCILSTLLFNIYIDFALRQIIPKIMDKGIEWHVNTQHTLGVRNAPGVVHENPPEGWRSLSLHHLLYADDTTLVARTCADLTAMVQILDQEFAVWGLKVSIKKTVLAVFNPMEYRRPKAYLHGEPLEEIPRGKNKTFRFLGSLLDFRTGSSDPDLMRRINLAQAVVTKLKRSVWRLPRLSTAGKMRSFKAMVLPVLLHGSENWTLTELAISKMEGFMGRTLRVILGLGWQDKVSFEEIRHRTGMCSQGPVSYHLRYRQLRWFGHVLRMSPDRWPHQMLFGRPPDSRRPQGRPWHRWIDSICAHLTRLGVPTDDHPHLLELARDRERWKALIKTPEPCVLCADAAAARDAAQAMTETTRKRPRAPASPPARRQRRLIIPNRQVPWSDPNTPWHLAETVAGPMYGRSRTGRTLKRPLGFSGPDRHCPFCHQAWSLTLEPRMWNVPVKEGECGVCGQQMTKRRKTS